VSSSDPNRKTSKQSPGPQAQRDSATRPLRVRRRLLLLIVGLLCAGGLYLWTTESAQSYYARAIVLLAKEPEKAEQLAARAIERAGGDFPAAQLLQCRALAATNHWDTALGGFSLIRDLKQCEPQELADLGAKAFESQQYQLGEMALEAALASKSAPAEVFEILVPWRAQQGRQGQALELCRAWQTDYPNDPQAWSNAADLEASNLEVAQAISDYREALRHSPHSDLENHIRGALLGLLADSGDVSAAREQLDIVLKSGVANNSVRLKAVEILRLEGKHAEAMEEITRYLENVEKSPAALRLRGILYLDQKDYQSAICDLKQVVTDDPFDKAAHIKLAQAYLKSGQRELAEPHFQAHRRLVEATNEILEINSKLERAPHDEALRKRLRELNEIIGRGLPNG
jgi:tetratricopeptide (TPR) repeat protein